MGEKRLRCKPSRCIESKLGQVGMDLNSFHNATPNCLTHVVAVPIYGGLEIYFVMWARAKWVVE